MNGTSDFKLDQDIIWDKFSKFHEDQTSIWPKERSQKLTMSTFCSDHSPETCISPGGDKIYVTNCNQYKLITLATDGTLISTFTDPELQNPECVHITPSGQVIVCAFKSNTVIQVDHQGKKKLATLASQIDGLSKPVSVCYNINTDQIIVEVDDSIMFYWTINVTSTVLTRFHYSHIMKTALPPGSHAFQWNEKSLEYGKFLTKFYWTINVTSRVLTRFHYSHIMKTALPPGSHAFQWNEKSLEYGKC
ncbi:hypothetical protein DPMN_157112 [Dreissena polymorpha]|uniref:Uncharacterized protein n=1 Tax=Dreissena polymorpha TaxID=45954 RepID=A0A9D4EGI1_DREPO|nr:hypothetical protein DPMN_157112 [Dreissena polymorpha]